jgi:type IV secretory pathway TrbD component
MEHKIATVMLIFIHNMLRPHTVIIRCPRYIKLFSELLVSILKLKLKLWLKFNLNKSPY